MRTPRTSLLTAAAAGALLLGGCGVLGGDEPTDPPVPDQPTAQQTSASEVEGTLLEEGTTEVELSVGEIVQVSLGSGSPGIGDDWGVISQTEDGVVDAEVVSGGSVIDGGGDARGDDGEAPGSETPFSVELEGVASGTSTVRVLYCTRSPIEEGCDQDKGTREAPVVPVEITVTVR